MPFKKSVPLTGMTLDRASDLRKSKEWFNDQLSDENSLFIIIHQGQYLFENKALKYFSLTQLSAINHESLANFVLLGLDNNQAIIVADFSLISSDFLLELVNLKGVPNAELIDFRRSVMLLDKGVAANLSYGRSLTHWHNAYRFCGYCGQPTQSEESGHMRQCTHSDCQKVHFPRTDPVVIMLVEYQPKEGPAVCLLANHTRSPDNLVSTLAGFVDPGESLEEAVIREVKEEVGLTVKSVEYVASQPWPFPSSLMLGFYAKVTDDKLILDAEEISSANWYSAEQVCQLDDWGGEGDSTQIPGQQSIARYLIEHWLEQKQ